MSPSPSDLAAINSATMGVSMPEVTLPDGQKVPTGTVAALIVNIRAYDELVGQEPVDEAKKAEMEAKLAATMVVLRKVGLFSLFTPGEWVQGASPGRKFIGNLALEEGAREAS